MALTYERNKNFPDDPRLNAVQFRKRTAGRPKKRGLALTRDPVPVEGLPGPFRGRGQPGGGGARGMLPGRARVRTPSRQVLILSALSLISAPSTCFRSTTSR